MSKLVAWSDNLAVGVPEVDGHHKGMVALLNELHENVHRRRGVAACREALNKLRRYAMAHFAVEENLMHLGGRTGYREDKAGQERLLELLDGMLAGMDETSSNITFHGLHQLKVWMLAHIRAADSSGMEEAVTKTARFRIALRRA